MDNLKVRETSNLRFYAVIFVAAVLVIMVLWWLVGLLTTGSLVVGSNSPKNAITVTWSVANKAKGSSTPKTLQSGKGVRLNPGLYQVMVQNGSSAKAQMVQIAARQTQKLELDLNSAPSPELVANANSGNFAASNTSLLFVDQSSQNLFQINNQNVVSNLNSSILFKRIKWITVAYGVGEDNSGDFYILNNGSLTPLATPQRLNKYVPFAVSPDGHIYVANGSTVWSGQPGASLGTYYTASQSITALSAANGGRLAVVGSSGTNLVESGAKKLGIATSAQDVSWSPNGNFLALVGRLSEILDTNLNRVAIIPASNLSSVAWLDNNTLLYSSNNQLWRYDVGSQIATVIAASPSRHDMLGVRLSDDRSYAYVGVENTPGSTNDLTIQRVGLAGQSPAAGVLGIQNSFPWLQGRCLLSIVNFAAPSSVDSFGGHPEDNCPAAARSYVAGLGADPSQFTYQTTDVPPDEPSQ